jgi:hypothetical protein
MMTLKTHAIGTTIFTLGLLGSALWANNIVPTRAQALGVTASAPRHNACLDTPAEPATEPVASTPVATAPTCRAGSEALSRQR